MITTEKAAIIFLEKLINRCYLNSLDNVINNIEDISTIKNPSNLYKDLHNWYINLSDYERLYLKQLLRETLYQTIFSFLVILDNMSPGMPLGSRMSDYMISIQLYKDIESMAKNEPSGSVRINNWRQGDIMLHDKFSEMITDLNR